MKHDRPCARRSHARDRGLPHKASLRGGIDFPSLWFYPIAVPAVCLILGLFLMPETKQNSIWAPQGQKA
jgi:hypothetical protein